MLRRFIIAGLALIGLGGCAHMPMPGFVHGILATKSVPDATENTVSARWDELEAGPEWTAATLEALRGPGVALTAGVPSDIDAWCPGYKTASIEGREAFWVGLLSSLSYHESTFNPRAEGAAGEDGLMQIKPATARLYGCAATTEAELRNGGANLACAVRIMSRTVARDGVVSEGMRGLAADWGPFHSSRKREDMRNWVSSQSYCEAK